MTKFLSILLLILGYSFSLHAQGYLEFIENKGQWGNKIDFRGDFSTGSFLLQPSGYRVMLYNKADYAAIASVAHAHVENKTNSGTKNPIQETPIDGIRDELLMLKSHIYEMRFLNANPKPILIPEKPTAALSNYLIGNDASKWGKACKNYLGVTYQNIYPNIDVRYYSNNGVLKYEFIIHPGGNPANIAMYFEGADQLSLKNGNLKIKTSVEEVTELAPYSFQLTETGRKEIASSYDLKGNILQFNLGESYDRTKTLVIDPSLVFSTFTGSRADNWGYTATYDGKGNFYAGGIVFGVGGSFPVSNGAYQQRYQGGTSLAGEEGGFDMAIMKFDPSGVNRIYATYLGGTKGNEQPHSMVVDNAGNLVIAGRTTSSDFPTKGNLKTYGPLGGGWDITLTQLNALGTDLVASVKIGGNGHDGVNIQHKYPIRGEESINKNYGDDARSEVIIDQAGNICFASCTQSDNFPTTAVSAQTSLGGINAKKRGQDAVVLKLTPNLSAVIFSVLIGGNDDDAAFVLAINPLSKNIFVAGATASANFPGNKTAVKYPSFQGGGTDGILMEFSPNGNLIRNGFFGTSGDDLIYGIQFDKFGFPYIMGTTTGSWPVVNAAFSQNNGKQFIAKLKPDLSDYVYSTVFGTGGTFPNISPTAFLVDRCENVYVSGWGGIANSDMGFKSAGTRGLLTTGPPNQAFQANTDNNDFYFFVLAKNASAQLYGSFFGQSGGFGEHVDGGTSRFDQNGVIYQSICANCGSPKAPFPTTPGVWSPVNGSQGCNLAAIKISFNLSGVGSGILSTINGVSRDSSGCVPMTVDFTDTLAMGKQYIWDFNDGSPLVTTTVPTVSHTFNTVGLFRVKLISVDSNSCNISDTSQITMRVRNDQANLAFTAKKLPPCASLTYEFDNQSTAIKPFVANSFQWDFGDGTKVLAGTNKITHTYLSPGTYQVKLILLDTNYCNEPDSIEQVLRISANVKAQFSTPAVGCVPYTATFTNNSLGGNQFIWDFGDGTSSLVTDPTHTYSTVGNYQVRLIAIDSNTCNQVDTSAYFNIRVSPNPTAAFVYSPQPTQPNTPVSFSNGSIGANSYLWLFGDGDTLFTIRPDTLVAHLYLASGTYPTCLVANNQAGCSDTACQDITVVINSLLDVPSAFSPNGDGVNDRIFVRGFGIAKMNWAIYNRWGKLVYRSSQTREGWDGTVNGVLQPQDVYHYILTVEFGDGEKINKKGDITLLR